MIQAELLTKRYGSTVAVDHLSFEVRPGCVTGFLGPNGAGKTTTMRLVLGLDAATSGKVTVNGRPYAQHRYPLHEVGVLLDAQARHPARSAYDHLACLAASNRIPRRRVDEVLDIVGLTEVAHRRAGAFSLGMNQRLGIAGALLGDPGVLMFDEPVNGLDPEGIVWIRNLLRNLATEGRTVFVSSHLMSEMALTAEQLIVIGRGRLIADASVDDITSRAASWVKISSPHIDALVALVRTAGGTVRSDDGTTAATGLDAAQIGELAAVNGIVLHELTPERASLEEAFFELTEDSVDYHAKETA